MRAQFLMGGVLCSLPFISHSEPHKSRPNVILILADDMRGSTLEFLGKEKVHTPNLNALAEDGLTFTNAHIMGSSNGAVSMPSRAMLMTGCYLQKLEKDGAVIPSSQTTIGETMKEAGYQTYHIGKWHNDFASFNRCFQDGNDIFFGGMGDHWNVPLYHYNKDGSYSNRRPVIPEFTKNSKVALMPGEYCYSGKHSVEIFSDEAIRFIKEREDRSTPFFLNLAYMSPHDPRSMPEKYLQMYDPDSVKLPDNFMKEHPFDNGELIIRDEQLLSTPRIPSEVREEIRNYYAMISHLDDYVGKVIRALKEMGEYDNTLIIFAADNGLAVGQHGLLGKQNVYEHSVGVPLIIKQAGEKSGKRTDRLCYLIDIYPTLCEILGQPKPLSVDGVSLLPVIKNDKPVRDHLCYSYKDSQRAVSDGEWKLIEYNVNGVRTTQLFNLKADPMECNNLGADRRYAATIKKLRKLM